MSYLVTPKTNGGQRKSVSISRINFLPTVSGRNSTGPYLIIGFDTEYQKVLCVNEDEQATLDNVVLSYQFSCMIIDKSNNGNELEWSGIVLPEGETPDDRLTLKEFVEFAIGCGCEHFPKAKIPRDVYLVAHFTRADVPAFKDFKDGGANRKDLNLDNIRNTFMNVAKDIRIDLHDDDFDTDIPISVRIRDTISLAPSGARKLEDLGDILGFPKIKLSDDPKKELHFKQNMKELIEVDWDKFREYAIRDAEVCTRYTSRMIRLFYEKAGKFKLPVTLTSIGVDLIEKFWGDLGVDPLEMVGKEQHTERYWSKKYNRYQQKTKTVFNKHLFWNEAFFTDCYHGGRNEQFWFGPAHDDVWYDYDLTSAYPSAMALIGKPDWSKARQIKDTDHLLDPKGFKPVDLAFANVDFEFDDSVDYPVLPVRTETGLIFPRKGNCSTHISEIILAQNLGCKIKLVEGKYFESKRHGNYRKGVPSPIRPFDQFTKYCIEQRNLSPKKTLDNLFWKELVNSTYGKTAQGLRERRIYDLRAAETKVLPQSKITNPVYASFITAFCRGVLGEIMNNLPRSTHIFSVTTDGFLTTASEAEMEKAAKGVLCRYYTSSRRRLSGEEKIFETKHIIRKPLGWRTRGQATLCPSKPEDWESPDDKAPSKIKENDRYVLAKAGIKLPHLLSKAQENDEIVKLFFERKPTDTLVVTLGSGIREMYEEGMDFVDKTMTKRLSMEFDWKRKPKFVGETELNFNDSEGSRHLFFSTKPWDDLNQFQIVRTLWESYNKDSYHCLKSKQDYHGFASYLENKLSLDGPAAAYLAKKDGDLKRLRRDLIIAHKHRKAGTHLLKPHAFGIAKIFPDYKLRAKDLATILNDKCGIPCKKVDVDNARKKQAFVPHQVPNTDQTRLKLGILKRNLFPDLDVSELLTKRSKFTIESESLETCILSQKMRQM